MSTTNQSSGVLAFSKLSYTVKTKADPKSLVESVSWDVRGGEMIAIMGPAGAGKSTLLDLMSGRKDYDAGGDIVFHGHSLAKKEFRLLSSFVEQEDALIGTLTARETLTYALRLAMPYEKAGFLKERVEQVLDMLGLQCCSDMQIGTPLKRGLSGGQKRRVSIGCCLVTYPRILYLDEPTSGLDSAAAQEVVTSVAKLARKEGIIVIASIHQPSYATLNEFTCLVLLSKGKLCFKGTVAELETFLLEMGIEHRPFAPPTDSAMQLLNTDFQAESRENHEHMDAIQAFKSRFEHWEHASTSFDTPPVELETTTADPLNRKDCLDNGQDRGLNKIWLHTVILGQRMALNYSRNILAYGIRAAMYYAGMGFMLATIWIHLGTSADTINDRLSVHFYSVAFLAFMSVAGIPGFLEERANFRKESANGLYSALPFVLANSIVTIPFLFMCSVVFVLIMYWGIGLHPGSSAVFRYIGFLFLSIYVAESQVFLIAALLPIFVAALAVSAFINGFWMSVGGYFLRAVNLPRFWYYSFHWMDYQTYSFELLANSDLRGLEFTCDVSGCLYPSTMGSTKVSGQDVLDSLNIGGIDYGTYAGILIGIGALYRIALWLILKFGIRCVADLEPDGKLLHLPPTPYIR